MSEKRPVIVKVRGFWQDAEGQKDSIRTVAKDIIISIAANTMSSMRMRVWSREKRFPRCSRLMMDI